MDHLKKIYKKVLLFVINIFISFLNFLSNHYKKFIYVFIFVVSLYLSYLSIKFFLEPSPEPERVRVTNKTENGFTVTWVTSTQNSKGGVFVIEEGKNWIPFISELFEIEYRDIRENEIFAQAFNEINEERYLTHYVNINDLEPEKSYKIVIKSGNRYYTKDISGLEIGQVQTYPVIDEYINTDLSYGRLETINRNIPEGALVYMYLTNEDAKSNLLAGIVNKDGNYFFNKSNARNNENNTIFPFNNSKQVILIEGVNNGKSFQIGKNEMDSPLPNYNIENNFNKELEPTDSTLQSLLTYENKILSTLKRELFFTANITNINTKSIIYIFLFFIIYLLFSTIFKQDKLFVRKLFSITYVIILLTQTYYFGLDSLLLQNNYVNAKLLDGEQTDQGTTNNGSASGSLKKTTPVNSNIEEEEISDYIPEEDNEDIPDFKCGNNICEYSRGESEIKCPKDCAIKETRIYEGGTCYMEQFGEREEIDTEKKTCILECQKNSRDGGVWKIINCEYKNNNNNSETSSSYKVEEGEDCDNTGDEYEQQNNNGFIEKFVCRKSGENLEWKLIGKLEPKVDSDITNNSSISSADQKTLSCINGAPSSTSGVPSTIRDSILQGCISYNENLIKNCQEGYSVYAYKYNSSCVSKTYSIENVNIDYYCCNVNPVQETQACSNAPTPLIPISGGGGGGGGGTRNIIEIKGESNTNACYEEIYSAMIDLNRSTVLEDKDGDGCPAICVDTEICSTLYQCPIETDPETGYQGTVGDCDPNNPLYVSRAQCALRDAENVNTKCISNPDNCPLLQKCNTNTGKCIDEGTKDIGESCRNTYECAQYRSEECMEEINGTCIKYAYEQFVCFDKKCIPIIDYYSKIQESFDLDLTVKLEEVIPFYGTALNMGMFGGSDLYNQTRIAEEIASEYAGFPFNYDLQGSFGYTWDEFTEEEKQNFINKVIDSGFLPEGYELSEEATEDWWILMTSNVYAHNYDWETYREDMESMFICEGEDSEDICYEEYEGIFTPEDIEASIAMQQYIYCIENAGSFISEDVYNPCFGKNFDPSAVLAMSYAEGLDRRLTNNILVGVVGDLLVVYEFITSALKIGAVSASKAYLIKEIKSIAIRNTTQLIASYSGIPDVESEVIAGEIVDNIKLNGDVGEFIVALTSKGIRGLSSNDITAIGTHIADLVGGWAKDRVSEYLKESGGTDEEQLTEWMIAMSNEEAGTNMASYYNEQYSESGLYSEGNQYVWNNTDGNLNEIIKKTFANEGNNYSVVINNYSFTIKPITEEPILISSPSGYLIITNKEKQFLINNNELISVKNLPEFPIEVLPYSSLLVTDPDTAIIDLFKQKIYDPLLDIEINSLIKKDFNNIQISQSVNNLKSEIFNKLIAIGISEKDASLAENLIIQTPINFNEKSYLINPELDYSFINSTVYCNENCEEKILSQIINKSITNKLYSDDSYKNITGNIENEEFLQFIERVSDETSHFLYTGESGKLYEHFYKVNNQLTSTEFYKNIMISFLEIDQNNIFYLMQNFDPAFNINSFIDFNIQIIAEKNINKNISNGINTIAINGESFFSKLYAQDNTTKLIVNNNEIIDPGIPIINIDQENFKQVSMSQSGQVSLSIDRGGYEVEILPFNTNIQFSKNSDGITMFIPVNEDGSQLYEKNIKILSNESDKNLTVYFYKDINNDGIKDASEEQWIIPNTIINIVKTFEPFELNINKGWNMLSFPFIMTNISASKLIKDIISQGGYISEVAYFNEGKWNSYIIRGDQVYSSEDFPIKPGNGYMIKSLFQNKIELGGYYDENYDKNITLYPGWNLIGFIPGYEEETNRTYLTNFEDINITAENVLESIQAKEINATNITRWNNGKYEGIVIEDGNYYGFDYKISLLNGYFIKYIGTESKQYQL